MSEKQSKRTRQAVKKHTPELLVKFHEYFIRPKPKWQPNWFWKWRLSRYVYMPK